MRLIASPFIAGTAVNGRRWSASTVRSTLSRRRAIGDSARAELSVDETRRTRTLAPSPPRRARPRSPRRAAPRPHAPDFEGADRIGEFWSYPQSRTFAELLIDCEEDKAARAVVFGLLAKMERK
jgi:hypothetical protein